MRHLSTQDMLLITGLAAAALLIGAIIGHIGWSLFVATAIWAITQQIELVRLQKWAKRPISRPTNRLDSWYAVSSPAYQFLKRERNRSREFLQRLRELSTLSEAIPDAAILVGSMGEIQDFNPAAQKLLRLTRTDRGLGLATVVRQPDFVRFLRDGTEDDQIEIKSPFESERTLETRRFDVDEGRTIVLVRDITELNRLLTMRQDFIANVSHELRTPLTVIGGYLETMVDPEEETETRLSLATRLSSPLRRMQSLVDDLLLLARLESTPASSELTSVAMPQLIQRTMREVQGLVKEGLELKCKIDTDARVTGVESELYSVCINLLTNAVRYSPDGGTITISYEPVPGASKPTVRLRVTDTGLGIAPKHLSRLTERFYRVDLAGSRTRGGTGLGLAIVKHVLLRHNSSLHIQSTLGTGSSFYCDFQSNNEPASTQLQQPNSSTTPQQLNQNLERKSDT